MSAILAFKPKPSPRQTQAKGLRAVWTRMDELIFDLSRAVLDARELDDDERFGMLEETNRLINGSRRLKTLIRQAQVRRHRGQSGGR
jgi:hypothetical protein